MRAKIRLDTASDARKFNAIASQLQGRIYIVDGEGLKVSATHKRYCRAFPGMEYCNR